MLDALPPAKTDTLMELGRLMAADSRTSKIDLGVGTYRDENGGVPIIAAVKQAERLVQETQTSKGYLGSAGDAAFCTQLRDVMLPGLTATRDRRIAQVQTPGGTGALRLALEVVARANPLARIWVGVPTWPAHLPLIETCGLEAQVYSHLDATGAFDSEALVEALSAARPGDVVLLHGCCHNPTGVDLGAEDWRQATKLIADRGLTPLIDLAYPGLGEGLEADVAGVHLLLEDCASALVALSCSKSFGLYRDRAGMLLMMAGSAATTANLGLVAAGHARLLWSNPPDHGAAVIKTILSSQALSADWRAELKTMRDRVNTIRRQLGDLPLSRLNLSPLSRQRGMFALLPLTPDDVVALRERHAIYMDISGRINVAGLNGSNFDRFAEGLCEIDRLAVAA